VSFDEKPHPEIVIIRRGGSSDDHGHHGGAWKIAYADFMTAMMALFLVMWLVNATDAKTISQIATYFNPISLTDRTTTNRGVQDTQQGGTGKEFDKQPPKTTNFDRQADLKNETGLTNTSDEGLFSDPYEVLDKLAERAAKSPLSASPNGIRQDSAQGGPAGEAFRDPFDPDFRFNSNTDDEKSSDVRPKFDAAQEAGDGSQPEGQTPQEVKSRPQKSTALPYGEPVDEAADEKAENKAKTVPAKKAASPEGAKDQPVAEIIKTEAAQIETELRKTIEASGFDKLPDISVEKTPEGVLISVTDQANFEMFALSSAEPRPELVVLMEKMAKILAKEPGELIIRGHTDARPFRSKTYDNWRLSTARAHIAHYMLMRGGLDKQRFERIEGYADREPKVPSDPNAAQNRRIEILLRPVKT
jgi:chemotaxis protein MotB